MTRDQYVELHCHSTFSLLDGASSPEALVARAAELGLPALALTERAGAAGAAARRAARAALGTLADVFPGRLAVECGDHGLAEERRLAAELVALAREAGLPWVPTTDAHYARAAGRVVHDVLC